MSTSKRRKIEASDGSQAMSAASAFALRRQLLSGNSTTVSPTRTPEQGRTPEDAPISPQPAAVPSPQRSRSPRKKVNGQSVVSAKGALNELQADKAGAKVVGESSGQADDSIDTAISTPDPSRIAPAKQFSTFRLTKQNSRKSAKGVLQLKLSESERFLVIGSFGVRLLSGEVTICGASIRPSDPVAWVHAPLCHAVPVLRCSEDAKLELHPHPQAPVLRSLERLSPLFRGLWNEPSKADSNHGSSTETFQIIYTSNDAPGKAVVQDLVSPPAWNKKLAELIGPSDKPPVVFLCGPKSSGKSTFGRILANKLLTVPSQRSRRQSPAVAVLDLDPGQPEYSPAGTIALVHVKEPNLSASFTHAFPGDPAASVVRLHAMASVSPASDVELYTRAALDLYHRYRQSPSLRSRPLVINTPGWILGTGLDLLTELATAIRPTNIVYMSEDGPIESVEALKATVPAAAAPNSNTTTTSFATLPSQQSDLASRTAAHFRSMQTMSYFHSQASDKDGQVRWDPSPLSARPPLLVSFVGPDAGILGILSYDFQPPVHLLSETINGSILAMVEVEDSQALGDLIKPEGAGSVPQPSPLDKSGDGMELDLDDAEKDYDERAKSKMLRNLVCRTSEGIPYIPNPDSRTLDPRHCQALGLALVRGIDVAGGKLQVLTPVALERIRESRELGRELVLVHGKFDTPGWAYTEDAYARTSRGGRVAGGGQEWVRATGEDSDEGGEDEMDGDEGEGDEDVEQGEGGGQDGASDVMPDAPWVEVLKGNEKRPVGSRVWRVRRDLGKGGPGGD